MPRPKATKLKAPTASRITSVPQDHESSKLRDPSVPARARTDNAPPRHPPEAAARALKEAPSKSNIAAKRVSTDSRKPPQGAPALEELLNEKFSSDSDHLVRKAKFRPHPPSRLRDENDEPPIMSGGLGAGGVPKAHKKADESNAVWQRVRKSMDAGKDPEVIQTRSPRMNGSQNYNLGVPRVGVESRPASVSKQQKRRPSGTDVRNQRTPRPPQGTTEAGRRLLESAYDPPLDDFSDLDLPTPGSAVRNPKTNAVDRVTNSFPEPGAVASAVPTSAAKGQATPSFLSMANFKRRPRQGSLLSMVRQDNTTASVDDYDEGRRFTLGASSTDEASSPEERSNDRSSSSRKRKAQDLDQDDSAAVSLPSISLNSHKQRKTTSDVHEASQARPSTEHAIDEPARPPTRGKDKEPEAAKTPKDPGTRPRASRTHRSTHSHKQPPRHRSSSPIDAASPVSSPASSPPPKPQQPTSKDQRNRSKNTAQKPAKKSPRVTAAHLTALLPKRRARGLRERAGGDRDDEFAILDANSSEHAEGEEQVTSGDMHGEDEEEDDLARPSRLGRFTKSRTSKGAAAAKGKSTGKKAVAAKNKTGLSRGATKTSDAGTLKSPNARGIPSTSANQPYSTQPKRTYGRQPPDTANDENDESRAFTPADDDDTTELNVEAQPQKQGKGRLRKPSAANSREMTEAARKFAEVDEWDLEFESASLGVDSSPWR